MYYAVKLYQLIVGSTYRVFITDLTVVDTRFLCLSVVTVRFLNFWSRICLLLLRYLGGLCFLFLQAFNPSIAPIVGQDDLILPCWQYRKQNSMWLDGLGQICDGNTLASFGDVEIAAFRDVDVAHKFVVNGDRLWHLIC